MADQQDDVKEKSNRKKYMGNWIGIGAGIGVAVHNISVGLGIGIAIGVLWEVKV